MEPKAIIELLHSNEENKLIQVVSFFRDTKPPKELLTHLIIACLLTSVRNEAINNLLIQIAPNRLKRLLADGDYTNGARARHKGTKKQRLAKYLDSLPPDDETNPLAIAYEVVKQGQLWGTNYIFKNGTPDLQRALLKTLIKDNKLNLCYREIEALPDVLKEFQQLTHLSLIDNKLQSFPTVITHLSGLEDLAIGSNWAIKELPPEIGNLRRLKSFSISDTQLSSLPKEINQLQHLKKIYLWNTKFKEFPIELTSIESLEYLSIQPCKIEAGLRDKLLKIKGLQTVSCAKEWTAKQPKYNYPFEDLP
jgi:Leucine-rich repeat (LRR) protein